MSHKDAFKLSLSIVAIVWSLVFINSYIQNSPLAGNFEESQSYDNSSLTASTPTPSPFIGTVAKPFEVHRIYFPRAATTAPEFTGNLLVHHDFYDDLKDVSPNLFHATGSVGFFTVMVESPIGTATTTGNPFLSLASTTSHVTRASLPGASPTAGSIAFWIRRDVPQNQNILMKIFGNSIVFSLENNALTYSITDSSGRSTPGTVQIPDPYWHHIALTYNVPAGCILLYVDAVQKGSCIPISNPINITNTSYVIGGTMAGASSYFVGNLDEFMVYSKSLSPSEIDALYKYQKAELFDVKLIKLSDYAGKVLFMHIGQFNCAPCQWELSQFLTLYPPIYQSLGMETLYISAGLGQGFLRVNYVIDDAKEKKHTFPIGYTLPGRDQILYDYGFYSNPPHPPYNLIINRNGIIRNYIYFYHPKSFYDAWIQPVLDEPYTPPRVNVTLAPTYTNPEQTNFNLAWTSANVTSCIADGPTAWKGTKALSGTQTFTNIPVKTVMKITCSGPLGTMTKSITTASSTVVTYPKPIINLSVSYLDATHQNIRLTWSTTNAKTCSAKGTLSTNTTGLKEPSGTETLTNIPVGTTFKFICYNEAGVSSEKSITTAP